MKEESLDSNILILDQEILLSDEIGEEEDVGPGALASSLRSNAAESKGPLYMVNVISRADSLDQGRSIPDSSPELEAAAQQTFSVLDRLLEQARGLASSYIQLDARTRRALYIALGHAYDFSLAAERAPDEFEIIVSNAGLTMQDRAPLLPLVKLVFGSEYDKTRLSEYATALSYGHRQKIASGQFTNFLENFEGGLKGVLSIERLLRRGEALEGASEKQIPSPEVVRKLEKIPVVPIQDAEIESDEFALVMVRRLPDGKFGIVGQVPRDTALLERAARKLIAEKGREQADQGRPVDA